MHARKHIRSLVKQHLNYNRKYSICFLVMLCSLCMTSLWAQDGTASEVTQLLKQSEEMLQEKNYNLAYSLGKEALSYAKQRQNTEEEGKSYLMLGKIAYQQQHYTEALPYAVQASAKCDLTENVALKISAAVLLTALYDQIGVYQRAIAHGEKLKKLYQPDSVNTLTMADLHFGLSQRYMKLRQYEKAEDYANTALSIYQRIVDTPKLIKIHELLVEVLRSQQKYRAAIPHAEWLNNIYAIETDNGKKILGLNNLGFLYQKIGERKKALDVFNEAVLLSEQIGDDASLTLLINLGLANSNLSNDKQAIKYYQLALAKQQHADDKMKEAELYNYLTSHYFLSGRQRKAFETAEKANKIALEQQDYHLLSDNYLLLKLIHQKEEHWEKVNKYDRKHRQIEEKLRQIEAAERQQQERISQLAELHEEEIRIAWNQNEKMALEQERKEAQIKLQLQELDLLKKEKELQALALEKQKLESRNTRQALSLMEQKLQSEQQKHALQELNRAKKLQALEIRKKELEQQQQHQKIGLLEADRELKEQKLLEESRLRKYGLGILVLCLLVLLVITFFLIQKNKVNQILREQKEEISKKNELLRQNEEILRNHLRHLEQAKQLLNEQKEQLTKVHNRVQESIEYAKHIQSSILPEDIHLKTAFRERCVIFMPKDVVSGDFYWVSRHLGYQIVIVADCTGHGVPGALITLIGHSLLTEAIQVHQMSEPDSILYFLHQRILDRFQNKDSTRQAGMDMGICVIHDEKNGVHDLYYAGAKNNLWLVKKGQLRRIRGDRYSIGGIQSGISFTRHHTQVSSNDLMYLSSDGFLDQPNPERERFGSGKLKHCIESWHQLPMEQQEQKLFTAFRDHKQEAELRDDITLLGFRF